MTKFKALWTKYEYNENCWFSLWSQAHWLQCALLLLNKRLHDDPLFNHVTAIDCEPYTVTHLVNAAIDQFHSNRISPCFYISQLTKPVFFSHALTDIGFRLWGQMDVMEYKGMNKTETTPVKTRRVGVELLPVWIQIFAESFEVSSSQAEEYLSRGRHLLRFTNTELLLAEIDSEVAGCVALYSKDRIGGIYFIATLPRFRRRGVASALLSAAVSRSIAHGNYSTILQTLRQSNLAKFYNKNDFDRRYSKEIYILE